MATHEPAYPAGQTRTHAVAQASEPRGKQDGRCSASKELASRGLGVPDKQQHVGDQQGRGERRKLPADLQGHVDGQAATQGLQGARPVAGGPQAKGLDENGSGMQMQMRAQWPPWQAAARWCSALTRGWRIMSCPNCW